MSALQKGSLYATILQRFRAFDRNVTKNLRALFARKKTIRKQKHTNTRYTSNKTGRSPDLEAVTEEERGDISLYSWFPSRIRGLLRLVSGYSVEFCMLLNCGIFALLTIMKAEIFRAPSAQKRIIIFLFKEGQAGARGGKSRDAGMHLFYCPFPYLRIIRPCLN